MAKCEICGKDGISLLYAEHKDFGRVVKVCQDCWRDAYAKNRFVLGSGSSSGCSCR